MPYIRYRGGRPPSSITEHAAYEDPNTPCRKGLAELMGQGRLFTEAAYNDHVERANALEAYMNSHSYPGLEHVGGVGLIQVGLRSIDEEITKEEYQRAHSDIVRARNTTKDGLTNFQRITTRFAERVLNTRN